MPNNNGFRKASSRCRQMFRRTAIAAKSRRVSNGSRRRTVVLEVVTTKCANAKTNKTHIPAPTLALL